MTIVRLEKGRNDFAMANMSLGKLEAVKSALEYMSKAGHIGIVGNELMQEMDYFFQKNPSIDCFGDDNVGKVKAMRR